MNSSDGDWQLPQPSDEELMLAFRDGDRLAVGELFARYGLTLLFWGVLLWLGWRGVRRPVLRLLGARAGWSPSR
ncbi:MAG: hypothetical protein ACE5HL_07940 [Terriglobia bacterium]